MIDPYPFYQTLVVCYLKDQRTHVCMSFWKEYDAFYDLQFCFKEKYSTNRERLRIIERIRQSLDKKTSMQCFYRSGNAFNTDNHKILLKKLKGELYWKNLF